MPPYVVLCAFQRFEVWMPGRVPTRPVAEFTLADLVDRYDALMFLAGVGIQAAFLDHHRALTTDATQTVTELYHRLADRSAAPVDELQRFVLQTVWCLFAEDLGMLDNYPLQTIVNVLRRDQTRSSYAELGALYEVLNQRSNRNRHGALKGTRYVNGELFARPAKLHLEPAELDLIARAAEFDWRKVNPTIFGSIPQPDPTETSTKHGCHIGTLSLTMTHPKW